MVYNKWQQHRALRALDSLSAAQIVRGFATIAQFAPLQVCRCARRYTLERNMGLFSNLFGKSKDNENEWPFDQPENVAAITTKQVLDDGLPILNVVHYEDDHSWAFTCGTSNKEEDAKMIGMGAALKLDKSLRHIADLPPGWQAFRESEYSKWQRTQIERA